MDKFLEKLKNNDVNIKFSKVINNYLKGLKTDAGRIEFFDECFNGICKSCGNISDGCCCDPRYDD